MWAAPREDHNRLFIALMAVLIALAWLALWFWGRPPDGPFYDHHGSGLDAFGGGAFMLVFVAGWTVMIVAMMLPTNLPLIALFRTLTRQRRDRTLLTTLLVSGYLGTWTLFGIAVYFGGRTLREAARQSAWLEANAWVVGASIVTLAGVYQFTPLKYHCLEKCRSPLGFVMEHWRGSRERSQAFRLGAHHGLFCVGCCWSLMLLMFVVGTSGVLVWMLALGAVMAVEKNVSWGRRISAPIGAILVGSGLILGVLPLLKSPGETITRVELNSTNGSGVSGTTAFVDIPDGVEVKLDVQDLPEPGATYLAHIHPGSCADERTGGAGGNVHNQRDGADESADGHHANTRDREDQDNQGDVVNHAHGHVDEIEHPLTPLVASAEGSESSTTTMKGATVDDLFSGSPGYYINVHAESSGTEELPGSVVCGNLREPDRTEPGLTAPSGPRREDR